jgi:LmeA-like phospholipid-binding
VKGLLIGLAVAVLILVGIDRVADFAAGRYAAERVAEQTANPGQVEVDFRGFPFLTQALRRTFGAVDVSARDARTAGLRIDRFEARLSQVRILSGDAVRAAAVTGRAVVSYAELNEVAQGSAQIGFGGDGLIKVTRTVTVLGQEVTVTARGRAGLQDGTLTVRPERVDDPGGPLGEVVRRLPIGRFEVQVPVQQFPDRLAVDVVPTESGVELRFRGTDLLLSGRSLTS